MDRESEDRVAGTSVPLEFLESAQVLDTVSVECADDALAALAELFPGHDVRPFVRETVALLVHPPLDAVEVAQWDRCCKERFSWYRQND